MAINVPLTNYNGEKISRHELLGWVNDMLSSNYNKIEELSSGIAYCQLMEKLFPNSIVMKKLKPNAKMEHEFLWNLKLFQSAFTKLECDKSVPINQLMKGKFQDNFEFLQWFKKFYDVNSGSNASKLKETNNNEVLKTSTKSSYNTTAVKANQNVLPKNNTTRLQSVQSPKKEEPKSPSHLDLLFLERDNLKEHCDTVEKEKLFYFERLKKIEILCDENENNPEFTQIVQTIRNLLYSTKDDEPKKEGEIEGLSEDINKMEF